jgi:hypothetical protein
MAAIDTANVATRIIELTGIAVIALGAFGTLFLFLYRFVSGFDRQQAIKITIQSRPGHPSWA